MRRRELPEVVEEWIDLHRLWRDSGGARGRRLDATGVDLRRTMWPGPIEEVRLVDCDLRGGFVYRGGEPEDPFSPYAGPSGFERGGFERCLLDGFAYGSFEEARLRGCSMVHLDAERVWFARARLQGCDLRHALLDGTEWANAAVIDCDLRGARLAGASLGGRFERCDLRGVDLRGAGGWFILDACDLRGALLDGTSLTTAYVERCCLYGAAGVPLVGAETVIGEVDLSPAADGSDLVPGIAVLERWRRGLPATDGDYRCDETSAPWRQHLSWARLSAHRNAATSSPGPEDVRLELDGADLRGARVPGARLERARFDGCDFTGADLDAARLLEAELHDCRFDQADLETAGLARARLHRCRFTGSRLFDATLGEAELVDCVFERADLRDAVFDRARLNRVRFVDCDLRGARTAGAVMEEVDLSGCAFDPEAPED